MKNRSQCKQCGYMFPWEDVGNEPRTPCPDCGSTDRHFVRNFVARVEAEATVRVKLNDQERDQRPPVDLSDEPKDEQGG